MKTNTKPANRFRSPVSAIISCLSPLLAAGTLASCGTGSPPRSVSSPVALQSAHWFKVKNHPPTYFPKGVLADHPTTHNDGSWVMTGDPAGTRYFIPLRGVDSRALTTEAMTTMTPERSKDLERGAAHDVNFANGIGNAAAGLGYFFLELDDRSGSSWNNQAAGKGQSGVWENKERR